jgi:hypothetical protein
VQSLFRNSLPCHISWDDRFPSCEQVVSGNSSLVQSLPVEVGGGQAPIRQNAALASAVVTPTTSFVAVAGQAALEQPPEKWSRLKYTCPGCSVNVWGKPGLAIICGACQVAFAVA